jgi:phosphotransferase system enzyme I (PtsI)
MAFALIGLGIRQLSVAPRSVPLMKRIVRGMRFSQAQAAAQTALDTNTAAEAEAVLRKALTAAFGDADFLRYGLPVEGDLDMLEDAAGH